MWGVNNNSGSEKGNLTYNEVSTEGKDYGAFQKEKPKKKSKTVTNDTSQKANVKRLTD